MNITRTSCRGVDDGHLGVYDIVNTSGAAGVGAYRKAVGAATAAIAVDE